MRGFNVQTTNAKGTTGCFRSTFSPVLNGMETDYIPHHAWFHYYASTANLARTRPTSTATIGFADPLDNTAAPVHHQYDSDDFFAAVSAGNYPSVSFLAAAVEDGDPGNSVSLDEQVLVTKAINFPQQQPDWKTTAVVIAYADSVGWYDRRFAPPTHLSFDDVTHQSGGSDGFWIRSAKRPGFVHADTVYRGFALGQSQLRGPRAGYSSLRRAVHRTQLARWATRWRRHRSMQCWHHHEHVRLRK